MATPAQVGAAGQAAGGIGGLIGSPPGGGGQQFLAPQQLPFLEQLFGGAAGLLEGGQLGQVAGFTPDQFAAFQGTRQAAAGLQPFTSQAQGALGGLLGGGGPFGAGIQQLAGGQGAFGGALSRAVQGPVTDPSQFVSDPLVQQTIQAAQRPVVEQFKQQVIPGITSGFGGAGRTGSEAQMAALRGATGQLGTTLGDISTGITGQAFQQGLQERRADLARQLQAAGTGAQAQLGALGLGQRGQLGALAQAPQIAGLGFLGPQALAQQGGLQQALAQQQLEAPFRGLSQFQQLIGPPITLQEQFPQAGTGVQGLLGEGGLLDITGTGGGVGSFIANPISGISGSLLGDAGGFIANPIGSITGGLF